MTKLDKPYQIEIAGVGGTGVLTAAMLIGNSALVQDIFVVQSEIHGMAQRGGVVNTEIRFGPVSGPLIADGDANVLLSFELGETARAIRKIIPKDGYVIMNSHKIVPPSLSAKKGGKYPETEDILAIIRKYTNNVFLIDAFKLASEVGDTRTQNVVLVGALFAIPNSSFISMVILRFSPNNEYYQRVLIVFPQILVRISKYINGLLWVYFFSGNNNSYVALTHIKS